MTRRKGSAQHKFTQAENKRRREHAAQPRDGDWMEVAAYLGTPSAQQCREWFRKYMTPNALNGLWTDAKDGALAQKHQELG
jgi:hypothetical protein